VVQLDGTAPAVSRLSVRAEDVERRDRDEG
jgi:hypothetical protein